MYDIDLKNIKKGRKFNFFILLFGLVFLFLIGGIVVNTIIKFNTLDANVLSENVEFKTHVNNDGKTVYSSVYYYEVDEKEYVCNSMASSVNAPKLTNKKVYYESSNPTNCMTADDKADSFFLFFFLIIPIVFIVISINGFIKVSKRIKIVNELNQKGKLVKNLPYRLVKTGMSVNKRKIYKPVVHYTLPSGVTVTLYGDARFDHMQSDADGMVDLLIDENNPNNYYIDFEINRLSGNLPGDYYNPNNSI